MAAAEVIEADILSAEFDRMATKARPDVIWSTLRRAIREQDAGPVQPPAQSGGDQTPPLD